MLTFESTHEYYLGPDADIYYHTDHEALIVSEQMTQLVSTELLRIELSSLQ